MFATIFILIRRCNQLYFSSNDRDPSIWGGEVTQDIDIHTYIYIDRYVYICIHIYMHIHTFI
jgi:hypothetical protein